MKKRAFSLFLALALCLGLLPATALAVESDFTIVDGVLTKYNGPGGDVVIPEGVTSISHAAFFADRADRNIFRLTIPSTVNSIYCYTTVNHSLTDVTIPASVTNISNEAFIDGADLVESPGMVIPDLTIHGAAGSAAESWAKEMGYTFVADQSWNVAPEATKETFTIENGVLKRYAGPSGDVVVPDGVTEIGYGTPDPSWDFYLDRLVPSLAGAGTGALDDIGNLNSLTLPAGIKHVHISNPYVKHITVGDGAECVTLNCASLESVTLPDCVTSLTITSHALRELVIPADIADWPTLHCPRLQKLTFPTDNWAFKGISRADFMMKLKRCPSLNEIVNCPNEFVDDLISSNAALRDNWTDPQSTIVAQPERIVALSNEITAGLTTDYDKAKAISQWVVDHIKYDDDYYYAGLKDYSDVPFDPQEILDKGQAVCAGFARLTQALLVAQNIPCLYVHGSAGGSHAWNLALIDGDFLWMDNTWGMNYFGLGIYAISEDHRATSAASFNNVKGPGTLVQTDQSETETQTLTAEEQKVRAAIEALKTKYPEGMSWTNSNSYYSKALHSSGRGCAGFAYICSDAAFGTAPITGTHSDFDKIKVGDILRILNDTHSVVVLEKREKSVIVTEGNYNSSIHWGREISRSALENGKFVATTRWGAARATGTAYASTQTVSVDGKSVTFECYALKDANGNMTNYIKLRDLADILNGSAAQFQVGWDGSITITTKTAYTPNGSEGNTPFSGNRVYEESFAATKVNGQTAALSAFFLKDDNGGGYTYFKLRDLGEALGFNVGWSADIGIFLETDKPYDPNN